MMSRGRSRRPRGVRLLAASVVAAGLGCTSSPERDSSTDAADATAGSERRDATPQPAEAGSTQLLPATTKGYELYAWDESGALSFTLITGTNRLKTVDEITGSNADVEEGEWVVLHGEGRDALERVLGRVPAGTSVVLSELQGVPALSAPGRSEVERVLAAAGH